MQNEWKQTKNEQNLHNWQFQSPNFQSFTKLVPGQSFSKKNQPLLFKSQNNHKWSLGKTIWKITQLVPILWPIDSFSPLGFKREKLYSWSFGFSNLANWVLDESLESWQLWSLRIQKITNLVLMVSLVYIYTDPLLSLTTYQPTNQTTTLAQNSLPKAHNHPTLVRLINPNPVHKNKPRFFFVIKTKKGKEKWSKHISAYLLP